MTTSDKSKALGLTPVSRETEERLDAFVALLLRWQSAKNLISPMTLPEVWTRHVADSLQLLRYAPPCEHWLDLGSGAGFPGLVAAIALRDVSQTVVHCVESRSGKAAFLREAARVTGVRVEVHCERLEKVIPTFVGTAQIVSARALAPMSDLVKWCEPLLCAGATGLFLKGQDVEEELTHVPNWDRFNVIQEPSLTDQRGRVVIMRAAG